MGSAPPEGSMIGGVPFEVHNRITEPQPSNPDGSAIPTPDTAQSTDPDTTLDGDAFVQSDDEAKRDLEPTDVFEVVVKYAQDRVYGEPPTCDSYDEARQVGIDLLTNHADALAFSITKSTVLR